MPKTCQRKFLPRLRIWKLHDPGTSEIFEAKFKEKSSSNTGVESKWAHLKNTLSDTAKEVCGFTKNRKLKRESWWWNDTVDRRISEKRKLWKKWKAGGDKQPRSKEIG